MHDGVTQQIRNHKPTCYHLGESVQTVTVKDGKCGMGYRFLLTKVFTYFGIPLGVGMKGTVK